jgi:hypothetical protein
VLRNARNALGRNPSMTANLDEEKIRDLPLVTLNAQFEGRAAGEVFNGQAKQTYSPGQRTATSSSQSARSGRALRPSRTRSSNS